MSGVVRWKNTGNAVWLASQPSDHGAVSVGVRAYDGPGLADLDRIPISYREMMPGKEGQTEFSISIDGRDLQQLRFELVAERVAWFSDLRSGAATVVVQT